MKNRLRLITAACILATGCVTQAQEKSPKDGSVSRAEYNKLTAEHEQLKQQMAEMQAQMRQVMTPRPAPVAEAPPDHKQVATAQTGIEELTQEVDELKRQVHETFPGLTKVLLTGYASAGFTARSGSDPSFNAAFNPIILWKMSDRLIFEGELELQLEGGDTTVALELAQVSYLLNGYMTVGVGKFLNPTNSFVERQHMAWTNKFPDKPLAVYDGLLPETELGAQLRGVIPIGPTKIEYAVFIANAPQLMTRPDDFSGAGTLGFDNFDNKDGHIAYGAHVGFIPFPELEIGYGFQRSTVGPRNQAVHAMLQSADLSYVRDSELLKGLINFRAQWVWSGIDGFTYDADGSQGFGPLTFSNRRNGGYVQLAYRPTKFGNDIVKNFEPVLRYDVLNQRNTPVGFDETRFSIGLDYWIGPSTVVKAAYEIDHQNGIGKNQNAVLLQVAVGF